MAIILATRVFSTLAFVTFIAGVCGETMIGNCNKTVFTGGANLCQRTAVENLALIQNATCESELTTQVACINKHVQSCLEGTLLFPFSGFVVDLIKHVVMNCGTVSGTVNDVLLQQLKCGGKAAAFDKTKNCWNDFASKVKANKKDPSLCSVYATAKHCVANITNKECPDVNMEKDQCNPFCVNGTDDPRRHCPVSLNCKREFYFEKEKECEKTFIGTMARNGACSVEIPKLTSCVKDYYKGCFSPYVDNALLDQLTNAIVTSSSARLFCNSAPLNTSALPSMLRNIVACNATFYNEADNCVKEFRDTYPNSKEDTALCRIYESANSCLFKSQEKHCQHTPALLQILNNTYNPFTCENKPHPTKQVVSRGTRDGTWMLSNWMAFVGVISCFLLPQMKFEGVC